MEYLVSLAERAERDLAELFDEIDAANSEAAWKWYRRLKKAVLSLEELPARCPATPEDARFRHLPFGRKPHIYRVIYRINESGRRVEVLHIRHGARREFDATLLE